MITLRSSGIAQTGQRLPEASQTEVASLQLLHCDESKTGSSVKISLGGNFSWVMKMIKF